MSGQDLDILEAEQKVALAKVDLDGTNELLERLLSLTANARSPLELFEAGLRHRRAEIGLAIAEIGLERAKLAKEDAAKQP